MRYRERSGNHWKDGAIPLSDKLAVRWGITPRGHKPESSVQSQERRCIAIDPRLDAGIPFRLLAEQLPYVLGFDLVPCLPAGAE